MPYSNYHGYHFFIAAPAGNVIWEDPANVRADEQLSHYVSKLSNDNYLLPCV